MRGETIVQTVRRGLLGAGSVLALGTTFAPEPAHAQFVCIVAPFPALAPQDNGGATAAGVSSFACGPDATATAAGGNATVDLRRESGELFP